MKAKNCPDCGVRPGERHKDYCDVERCPECGRQLISCGCNEFTKPRIPWSGLWPGVKECREFGWYSKLVSGIGWVKCNKNDPEATEDLNRLYIECKWDKNLGKFVKKV